MCVGTHTCVIVLSVCVCVCVGGDSREKLCTLYTIIITAVMCMFMSVTVLS